MDNDRRPVLVRLEEVDPTTIRLHIPLIYSPPRHKLGYPSFDEFFMLRDYTVSPFRRRPRSHLGRI